MVNHNVILNILKDNKEALTKGIYKSYFEKDIPFEKLRKNFYDSFREETAIAFFDATTFGNCKGGLLFSDEGIYYKYLKNIYIFAYEDISHVMPQKRGITLKFENPNLEEYTLIDVFDINVLTNIFVKILQEVEKNGDISHSSGQLESWKTNGSYKAKLSGYRDASNQFEDKYVEQNSFFVKKIEEFEDILSEYEELILSYENYIEMLLKSGAKVSDYQSGDDEDPSQDDNEDGCDSESNVSTEIYTLSEVIALDNKLGIYPDSDAKKRYVDAIAMGAKALGYPKYETWTPELYEEISLFVSEFDDFMANLLDDWINPELMKQLEGADCYINMELLSYLETM